MLNEWNGFNDGVWTKEINVRNFIQKNYTLYEGDDSFLADVSQKTKKSGINVKNCWTSNRTS